MKNKLRVFGHIVLCLLCVVIGFFLGKIVMVPGVTCSKEINPLHGVSILFSLFAVIYVALMLDKYKESQRKQRELIYDRIDDLLVCVNSINLEEESICLTKVNIALKKMWVMSTYVSKFIKLMNLPKNNFEHTFKVSHKELRELLTNTPVTSIENEDPPIKCERGILIYNYARRGDIEANIDTIKNLIFDLQFNIAKT